MRGALAQLARSTASATGMADLIGCDIMNEAFERHGGGSASDARTGNDGLATTVAERTNRIDGAYLRCLPSPRQQPANKIKFMIA
jgi:hypothetical protein